MGSPQGGLGRSTLLIVSDEPLRARSVKVLIDDRLGTRSVCVGSLARAARMLGSPAGESILWLGEAFDGEAARQTRAIRDRHPRATVLVVARSAEPADVQMLLAQNPRGIGFLVGAMCPPLEQIATLLDQLADGRFTTLDASLVPLVLALHRPAGGHLSRLTAPEREVLELVAAGLRNCEIARRLFKSEKAIEKHIGQIFTKLKLGPASDPVIDRRVTAARIYISAA